MKRRKKLGIDQVAIHKMNAPEGQPLFGLVPPNTPPGRPRNKLTSCFVKECLDKGAEMFNWEARKANERPADRQQGPRRRRGHRCLHRRIDRRRRPLHPASRRQARNPPGRRQPRHALDVRHRARDLRGVGLPVGADRSGVGQHVEGPAVVVDPGRQPDDVCAYPRELRDGHGLQEEAHRSCGEDARRQPRRLRHERQGRHPQGRRPGDDVGEGGRARPSSSAASTTAPRCRRKSTP